MYLQTSDMLHVAATCVCTLLQDRAYAVWQRMVKAGVVPNEVTQRILVHCFKNNLQMASALVKEARQLRVRWTAILSLQIAQSCHILCEQCRSHPISSSLPYISHTTGCASGTTEHESHQCLACICIHPWTDIWHSSSQRLSCYSFCRK